MPATFVDPAQVHPPRKVGERWEYINLTFWPENGLIYVEDGRDASFSAITRPEWVARILHFNDVCRRLRDVIERTGNIQKRKSLVQEWETTLKLIEAMVDVNRRAKAQGDPTDEAVLQHVRTHKPKSQIVVPADLDTADRHRKLILPSE